MKRDHRLFLRDILEAMEAIESFNKAQDLSFISLFC
jgi:uncharacterized protein with HEPN domain